MDDDMLTKSILEQLDPSPEQMKPILERGQNIVVTAGAGTGKTRTLVARYLSLLEDKTPMRKIFAITFTNKAAREMRNRIREEVRTFMIDPVLDAERKVFWRDIYENLDSARISTIHSLASDLLRQHPAELGVDPKFELLDEGQAARLRARAIEASLTWGSDDTQAAVIFPIFGVWKLRRIIAELLSKRLEIDEALDGYSGDIWQIWLPILIEPIKRFVDHKDVISALDEFQEYEVSGLVQNALDKGDLFANDLRIVVKYWKMIKKARTSNDWPEISRYLGSLRSHLKQKGKKENWAPGNPRELVKLIQPIYDDNIGFDNLDLAVDQKLAQEIIPGIRAVFHYANSWYDNAKDDLNGLDFEDLERKALILLKDFPSAKDYWQDQIHALLVDEYQDTNHRQRELVNLLNGEGNRLFIVGDGKQSIYRFRGADVAVFRQEQKIISRDGSSYELSTSYRAHPGLLNNLNMLLEPVLGSNSSLPFVEPFSPLLPGRDDTSASAGEIYIELHLAAGTKADGAGRTAAEAVASRIIALVEESRAAEINGSGKSLKYDDFAILCRASSSFSDFEFAFEQSGIPYLTIAGQGFYDRPEVRDLLNALVAFSDPQNDLAIAGLMRSPVIGLPDDMLLYYRDLQRSEEFQSLFETVKLHPDLEDDELSERSQFLVAIIERYSSLVGRISAADILSQFMEETGYIAAMAIAGYHRNIQNMKKLVSDAQKSGVVSLPDFLNTIAEMRNVSVREGEAASVSEGSVQIMTVHQSKGLEFPVVILGDASKKERLGRDIVIDPVLGIVPPLSDTRIEYVDPQHPDLVTSSSFAYEIALEAERAKEEAESNRLLYVAATRAQDLLIISGVLGRLNKSKSLGKLGGWLETITKTLGLQELPLDFRIDGNSIYPYQISENGIDAAVTVYENKVDFSLRNSMNNLEPEIKNELGKLPEIDPLTLVRHFDKGEYIPGLFWATSPAKINAAPARVVGDVVHRALQLWKFPGQDDDFINWAATEFMNRGVIRDGAIKNGYRRAKNLLMRFQDHDLFSRMNSSEKLLHEIPYSLDGENGQFHSGIIDALFKENGRWFIVEFKTDEIRDKLRFDWVWKHEDYQQQMDGYLEAVETILGDKPEAILCFLNYEQRVYLMTDEWK